MNQTQHANDANSTNANEVVLVTAALPYVNNIPHLGNIVGSHLPADIFARYCKLTNKQVLFVGGTDENGTTTEVTAYKLGVDEQQLCDRLYAIHKEIYDWFNFSYDIFSRTSKQLHYATTQDFFLKLYENGYISEKIINVAYCKNCKHYLSDRYMVGQCPYCGYEHAHGDQCEACGKLLEPSQLINPKCVICGSTAIEFKQEKHLFFELPKVADKLKRWISNAKWRKHVKAIANAWLDAGLKPRCITRNVKFGVPVPLKGFEDKTLYVWFDAPIGYITFTKEVCQQLHQDWQQYWKNEKAKIYFFIGKDNIPFHTIFFPGMLIAHGSFTLPYNVVGLNYLNLAEGKFSKSKKRGVFCETLMKAEQQLGITADYWRFYLSLLIPETKDTEFDWNDFKTRINAELIGKLANLVYRVLSFAYKNNINIVAVSDDEHCNIVRQYSKAILEAYEHVELRKALKLILELADFGNKFTDEKQIWKTKDQAAVSFLVYLIKDMAILLWPFLPSTAEKIASMLGISIDIKLLNDFNVDIQLQQPKHLFKRIDDNTLEKLKQITSQPLQLEELFK